MGKSWIHWGNKSHQKINVWTEQNGRVWLANKRKLYEKQTQTRFRCSYLFCTFSDCVFQEDHKSIKRTSKINVRTGDEKLYATSKCTHTNTDGIDWSTVAETRNGKKWIIQQLFKSSNKTWKNVLFFRSHTHFL